MNCLFPFACETNVLLKDYSTFGIGGPANYFTEVADLEEIQKVIRFCYQNGLRYYILGKGSNCLFDDRGFNGLVILNRIDYVHPSANVFRAGAGFSFARLGSQTARKGFSGLEFASGIPATVGGAVYMNAGANGKETSQFLKEVLFLDEKGDLLVLKKNELLFDYRTSSFQKKKGMIVEATFVLEPSNDAKSEQKKILDYRLKTQPYGEKSAGCVFRNLECLSAGALIDQTGLKGLSFGNAEVSDLHANFIVNKGRASAKDVLNLIQLIKEKVFKKHGIHLEEEIRLVPFNDE